MIRSLAAWWCAAVAVLFSFAATGAEPVSSNQHHVVIISLDGMRPEFYLPGALSDLAETLTGLRDQGSYAKGALPPYPSLTYPGHTSIATGVNPARHGIYSNNLFDPAVSDGRGFWFATDVKAPTLWDAAHTAGLTVGAVSWPCTAGSKTIDWDFPEFWTTPLGSDLQMIRRYASTNLVKMVVDKVGEITPERRADAVKWDDFLAGTAEAIIRDHKPNLMFVHLIETDKAQHHAGRASDELPPALRRADGRVYDVIEATKQAGIYENTTFIILGDHGFADVSESIAPNVLLANEGFIKVENKQVTDWTAMVQNTGGSAGVYLKDPQDQATAARVLTLLKKSAFLPDGKKLYRIIDKEELVKLGGPRDAIFYLEAEPGYTFSGSVSSEYVRSSSLKGNHGFLPTTPGLQTGFLVAGRGIKQGVVLDSVRLIDVAPTVAALLGMKLEGADGRVLTEFLK